MESQNWLFLMVKIFPEILLFPTVVHQKFMFCSIINLHKMMQQCTNNLLSFIKTSINSRLKKLHLQTKFKMEALGFLKRNFKAIRRTTVHQVRSLDRAPHSVTFSYNNTTQYKSFFGGLVALIIIGYLVFVFLGNLFSILSMQNIIADKKIKIDPQSQAIKTTFGNGMMFAIGIEELDFRYEKVFDLRFSTTKTVSKPRNRTEIRRNQTLKLLPCTPDIWQKLGLIDFYFANQFEQMLCVNPKDVMRLSDTDGYRLQLERCGPESPQPSNSASYIQQLNNTFNNFSSNTNWTNYYENQFNKETYTNNLNTNTNNLNTDTNNLNTDTNNLNTDTNTQDTTYYQDQDYDQVESTKVGAATPTFFNAPCYYNFYQKLFKLPRQYRVQFYYVNTVINALERDYANPVVEYQEFFIEITNSSTLRTETDFYLGSYEVLTNHNIFNDYQLGMQNKTGFIKMKPMEVHSFIYDPENVDNATNSTQNEKMNNYFTLDIKKSNQVVHVYRTFQTVEGLFQTIGGYLAFFGTIFAYLFLSYNQLCFQLQIVSSLYYKTKNQPIEASNPSYLKFLIFKFWNFLGRFKIKPNWRFCLDWEEISASASEVLDMQTVVRKIQHLQKVGKAVLDQDKYYALYLQQPQNIQDEKDKRSADSVYNKLRSKYFNKGQIDVSELQKFRIVMGMIEMSKQRGQKPSQSNQIAQKKENNAVAKKYSLISQISGKKDPMDDNIESEAKEQMEIYIEQFKDESDENYIDPEMFSKLRSHLEKMKTESRTCSVAARIYEAIDPNIKCILLNQEIPTIEKKQSIIAEPIIHQFSSSLALNQNTQRSSTSFKVFPEGNKKR